MRVNQCIERYTREDIYYEPSTHDVSLGDNASILDFLFWSFIYNRCSEADQNVQSEKDIYDPCYCPVGITIEIRWVPCYLNRRYKHSKKSEHDNKNVPSSFEFAFLRDHIRWVGDRAKYPQTCITIVNDHFFFICINCALHVLSSLI